MYEFIQQLPNNPVFVLILLAVFGLVWFGMPKTKWWKRHISDDFPSHHHPLCFNCNEGNDACYEDASRCAAMRDHFKLDSQEG